MSSHPKDPVLRAIRDTLNGNPEAYTLIVTTYMDMLHRTALCLCTHPDAAEDLVQETLIDGFLHLSELREPEKIGVWLTHILKRKTLRQVLRARRTELMEELPETPDHNTPDALYRDSETMRKWRLRLENLSSALRETAILYFLENRTMEEIADLTSVPVGTVKSRIHAARAKLRKEHTMSDTTKPTLPDSFAESLEKKVQELADYHKLYGTANGFDALYRGIKELIPNLSSKEDVKKYACRSAAIAAKANENYTEEAFETFHRYDDVESAGRLYLKKAWKKGTEQEQADFLASAIRDIESYQDSESKESVLGYLTFWQASSLLRADQPYDQVEALYSKAMAHYRHVSLPSSMFGNVTTALKAMPYLRQKNPVYTVNITGESWLLKEGNIYYFDQPGFSMGSALYTYDNPVFYYSGYGGDHYFFPRTIPLSAEGEEVMINDKGQSGGIRRVVSVTDTVGTPAGTFENCVHIQKDEQNGNVFSAWYKEGVGLVKSVFHAYPAMTKVLSSYEIHGGEGLLPVAVGNTWRYESPSKPDEMIEVNEYVIEQAGQREGLGEMATLSCLNYLALKPDWESRTQDPTLRLALTSGLCDEKKYSEAAESLRAIVMANRDRESVDMALSLLRYLEEKAIYDAKDWRFCPSSANISTVTRQDDRGRCHYHESPIISCDTGPWGTRFEENQIFGVKPFRFLQMLTGTLWDDRWVPGYSEELPHPWEDSTIRLNVTDGGVVETPSGTYGSTVCLSLEAGNLDAAEGSHYFYNNTDHGRKQFWFAPGVGVVRFACEWGKHLTSDCLLTAHRVIAAPGETMPFHIGNRWQYDEVNLTAEGYIARREYEVLAGIEDRFLLGDHQMFTFKGTMKEYDAFKESLKS